MKKYQNFKLSIFFILFPLFSFGQITFQEVLSLEKSSYKEIQAFMLRDYTIINDSKEYRYFPIKACNPPQFANDSCTWICTMPDHLDEIRSKYPLDKVKFKESSNQYYEVWEDSESTFAENYNVETKKATTFLDISERKSRNNANCLDEFRDVSNTYKTIEIQFSDPEHWKDFKRSVSEIATFQSTWRPSEDQPIYLRYGIRRQIVNGYWKGVFINLHESGSTYHASISFNSSGVN